MPSFRYVLIPAGGRDAIEEKELQIPKGKDVECFLDHVKHHFSSTGGEKTEAMRAAQRQVREGDRCALPAAGSCMHEPPPCSRRPTRTQPSDLAHCSCIPPPLPTHARTCHWR